MIALLLALAAEAGERRYAVMVGANRGLATDLDLRYAESDARRMGELLVTLGGVPAANLTLVQGRDSDDVREVFDQLGDRLRRESRPGERSMVVVYYSGHADGQALHLLRTELPTRELREAVAALPADLRLLVVDACESGDILRAKGAAPTTPFPIAPGSEGLVEGFAVITATGAGEDAQESERLQGGVFTHHLLAGLAGAADSSGDARVSLQEAWRYAQGRTVATTSRAPVVQHPSFAFDLQGQADLVLTTLAGARRTGRLLLQDPGVYVLLDLAETRLVAEVEVAAGGRLALPEGEYRVRRRLPDRVDEGSVIIRSGEDTLLAGASLRSLPYGQSARRGETQSLYTAVGVVAGGGVHGPLDEALGIAGLGTLGLRADLPWLSVFARGRYSRAVATNDYLSTETSLAGGEVTALRMFDLGPTSLGLGLGGGLDAAWQDFVTDGEAPSRQALAGHVGPVARAEIALASRLSLGFEAGWDIYTFPGHSAEQLVTTAVPRGSLDATVWLR